MNEYLGIVQAKSVDEVRAGCPYFRLSLAGGRSGASRQLALPPDGTDEIHGDTNPKAVR